MPTENEVRVLKLLTQIDLSPSAAAEAILAWGPEAVTVLCEAALGQYPGLRLKVRTNATALLGWTVHPQTQETIDLLIRDPIPDVATRAIRAAGRTGRDVYVSRLEELLSQPATAPLLAAEAASALRRIGSAAAHDALDAYKAADPQRTPHRGSRAVAEVLEELKPR
jgi:HEAT repeat protein